MKKVLIFFEEHVATRASINGESSQVSFYLSLDFRLSILCLQTFIVFPLRFPLNTSYRLSG